MRTLRYLRFLGRSDVLPILDTCLTRQYPFGVITCDESSPGLDGLVTASSRKAGQRFETRRLTEDGRYAYNACRQASGREVVSRATDTTIICRRAAPEGPSLISISRASPATTSLPSARSTCTQTKSTCQPLSASRSSPATCSVVSTSTRG